MRKLKKEIIAIKEEKNTRLEMMILKLKLSNQHTAPTKQVLTFRCNQMKLYNFTLACNWLSSDLRFSTVMDRVLFSSLTVDNCSTSFSDIFCNSSY